MQAESLYNDEEDEEGDEVNDDDLEEEVVEVYYNHDTDKILYSLHSSHSYCYCKSKKLSMLIIFCFRWRIRLLKMLVKTQQKKERWIIINHILFY